MAQIIIVGDGPGGLSAAVFLARGGHDVTVFGLDKTAVNYARLNNYLGVLPIDGPDFQAIARGQATTAGATLRSELVTEVSASDRVGATTEGGDTVRRRLPHPVRRKESGTRSLPEPARKRGLGRLRLIATTRVLMTAST